MKQHEMVEKYQGLHGHVRAYTINEDEDTGRELKHWISGYRSFQRGEKRQ